MNGIRSIVFACFILTSAAVSADELIKIGSWNIEHFGESGSSQNAAAVAQHIALSGVDVLALQEIADTNGDAAGLVNTKLDAVMAELNETDGNDWKYVLLPKRTTPPEPADRRHTQHCAVAWNAKKFSQVSAPFRVGVAAANDDTWKRDPHAVQFTAKAGKTDFVLIPLHMKSNSSQSQQTGLEPAELRLLEAEALVEKLAAVRTHFNDEDIVLLGDTNCLEEDEPALEAFADAGFTDLNRKNAITYAKGSFRNAFDRILIPVQQSEFTFATQYVLTPADDSLHLRRLSDHRLVVTCIRVENDDD
jgi:predicted extracellular nuclease